jgi:L-asparaginase
VITHSLYFYPDMQSMQSPAASAPARVLVLGTGGTIAGVASADPAGYRAGVLGIEALLGAVPGIGAVATLQAEQIADLDSKDMVPALWSELAARIARWQADSGGMGCVVTHGSDTLEETAYALQCLLPQGAPVVLTAALRPATALSADGPRNLFDAVRVAASVEAGGRGVLAVLDGQVHGARDLAKLRGGAQDVFSSGARGPLGFVDAGGVRFTRVDPQPLPAPLPPPRVWPRVEIVSSHAGADGAVVRALLDASRAGRLLPPLAGLVVLGTGSGTVHAELLASLEEAARAGVQVRVASRLGGDAEANGFKLRVRLMLEIAAAA